MIVKTIMSKPPEYLKYQKLAMVVCVICTIISFIVCDDIKKSLEILILPSIDSTLLKTLAKTAIIASFYVPLLVGGLLAKTQRNFLQVIGMLFVGIGVGPLLRLVLIITGIMYPYG
jgi:hypothetical protein